MVSVWPGSGSVAFDGPLDPRGAARDTDAAGGRGGTGAGGQPGAAGAQCGGVGAAGELAGGDPVGGLARGHPADAVGDVNRSRVAGGGRMCVLRDAGAVSGDVDAGLDLRPRVRPGDRRAATLAAARPAAALGLHADRGPDPHAGEPAAVDAGDRAGGEHDGGAVEFGVRHQVDHHRAQPGLRGAGAAELRALPVHRVHDHDRRDAERGDRAWACWW